MDRRESKAALVLWAGRVLEVHWECLETGEELEHLALWASGAPLGMLVNQAQWVQWESLEVLVFQVLQV